MPVLSSRRVGHHNHLTVKHVSTLLVPHSTTELAAAMTLAERAFPLHREPIRPSPVTEETHPQCCFFFYRRMKCWLKKGRSLAAVSIPVVATVAIY